MFLEIKEFVIAIQSNIGLNGENIKATVTTFGIDAHRNIKRYDCDNILGFNNRVAMLQPLTGSHFTNTRAGLEKGQLSIDHKECGIIIVITDGLANIGINGE